MRRSTWLLTTLGTVITAVLVTTLTSLPSQIFGQRELGDSVRVGAEMDVKADTVNDTGIYSMAMPGLWNPPPDDPARDHIDGASASALVHEEELAGGFAVPYLRVRLVLESRRNQQINITDLAVTNLRTGPPIRGTLVGVTEEGRSENQQIAFDLGQPIPRATDPKIANTGDNNYFKNNSISLTEGEQVVLLAQFNPQFATSAQFTLNLFYTIAGRNGVIPIDNNGQPFRVTSPSCSPIGHGATDYGQVYNTAGGGSAGLRVSKSTDLHPAVSEIPCK